MSSITWNRERLVQQVGPAIVASAVSSSVNSSARISSASAIGHGRAKGAKTRTASPGAHSASRLRPCVFAFAELRQRLKSLSRS